VSAVTYAEGDEADWFITGIGYERVVGKHSSISGNVLAGFSIAPFACGTPVDISLAGRYYFGGTPLKGPYAAMALGYSEWDFFLIGWSVISISGFVGHKFMLGPFYLDIETGGGIGFGKFFSFWGIADRNAGFIPHLALNMGIVF